MYCFKISFEQYVSILLFQSDPCKVAGCDPKIGVSLTSTWHLFQVAWKNKGLVSYNELYCGYVSCNMMITWENTLSYDI